MLFEIEQLADEDLLARLQGLMTQDHQTTARLVAHLGEIDARKLHLGEGFSSMFLYCTQVLHFSESTAYRRIETARVSRRFPVILERIADGSVHLTAVTLLAPHLTAENHLALLESARHRTRRQIEHLVSLLAPPRDGPPRSFVVSLPRTTSTAAPARPEQSPGLFDRLMPTADQGGGSSASHRLSGGGVAASVAILGGRTAELPVVGHSHFADFPSAVAASGVLADTHVMAPPGPPSVPAPVEGGFDESGSYRLHVTISEATRIRLERAKALMRHVNPTGDLALILDQALATLIDILERRKFARLRGEGIDGAPGGVGPSGRVSNAGRRSKGGRAEVKPAPASGQVNRVGAGSGVDIGNGAVAGAGKGTRIPSSDRAAAGAGGLTGTGPLAHHKGASGVGNMIEGSRLPTAARSSRRISAPVRRAVWRRDEGRCTFVGRKGRPCGATERLEYHHIVPWSHGGADSTANLTLRCHAHHRNETEVTMGRSVRSTRTGASSKPGRPAAGRSKPGTGKPRKGSLRSNGDRRTPRTG